MPSLTTLQHVALGLMLAKILNREVDQMVNVSHKTAVFNNGAQSPVQQSLSPLEKRK